MTALLGAIAAALVLVTASVAAPPGPEGPGTCTFSKGTTTCGVAGEPDVQSTSVVDRTTHCRTTTTVTTVTTTFYAHHGTYNSHGAPEDSAPGPVTTQTTSVTTTCP